MREDDSFEEDISSEEHRPVMLKETLDTLEILPGSWYVDANLGGGGHTRAILERGGKECGEDLEDLCHIM